MKKYGHTGTLFLQNGKYYKWSYKFDHCINCGTCKFKHKGKGFCTSCFDKERRNKSEKRRINLKKQRLTHYFKKRVLHFLNKKERSKRGPEAFLTDEDKKIYKKQWYKDNFERLSLQQEIKRRLRNNLPCLKVVINGKDIFLPFESLEKPKTVGSGEGLTPEYFEWKEKSRHFNILVSYYKKIGKRKNLKSVC